MIAVTGEVVMQFSSFIFLCFFPIVVAGFWLVPGSWKKFWLLVTSIVFIMGASVYAVAILFLITAFSFIFGWLLGGNVEKGKDNRFLLWSGIICCLLPLILMKYHDFLPDIWGDGIWKERIYSLTAPVGISFYTLQAIGYLIDVYRGEEKAELNPFYYILYMSYFPKFISGPLMGTKDFFNQIKILSDWKFSEEDTKKGLLLMMWGYFQKLILSDNLAILVARIYDFWEGYSGTVISIGTVLFAIQLYADFAGYSCIAIGASRILGVKIDNNFRQPYFAAGIREFWRRWHISLSLWLRKYIYISLGGNRKGTLCKYRNILITFLVSGLWHGASWSFMAWGGLHGIYQILEDCLNKLCQKKLSRKKGGKKGWGLGVVRRMFTFMLVVVAWLFFRASGLKTALRMFLKCMTDVNLMNLFDGTFLMMGLSKFELTVVFIALVLLLIVDILHEKQKSITVWLNSRNRIFRWGCYLGMLLILFIAVVRQFGGEASGFIYAQF